MYTREALSPFKKVRVCLLGDRGLRPQIADLDLDPNASSWIKICWNSQQELLTISKKKRRRCDDLKEKSLGRRCSWFCHVASFKCIPSLWHCRANIGRWIFTSSRATWRHRQGCYQQNDRRHHETNIRPHCWKG